jgi:hypothetical protein
LVRVGVVDSILIRFRFQFSFNRGQIVVVVFFVKTDRLAFGGGRGVVSRPVIQR